MDKAVLQVGDYRVEDFDQLLRAVAHHNLGIGTGLKIKDRKPQRLYISCSPGEECGFRVNALLVDGVGLRMTKFQEHNCKGCSVREMQQKTAFIRSMTDTVYKFVIGEGRRAGDTAQLEQMVKEQNGLQGSRDTYLRVGVPMSSL